MMEFIEIISLISLLIVICGHRPTQGTRVVKTSEHPVHPPCPPPKAK